MVVLVRFSSVRGAGSRFFFLFVTVNPAVTVDVDVTVVSVTEESDQQDSWTNDGVRREFDLLVIVEVVVTVVIVARGGTGYIVEQYACTGW